MGCRGVHFALDTEIADQLKGFATDEERLEYVINELENDYFEHHREWLAETDKAWDAIHRTLTDGTLSWDGGRYPLNHVILGSESLYSEDDYIMSLKTPAQVREIAAALKDVTRDQFRQGYDAIDPESYYAEFMSEEDFEYTWDNYRSLREFYDRAAAAGRYVLFTADQ